MTAWSTEKLFPSGFWLASAIVGGQLRRFQGDTKAGAMQLAREFERAYRAGEVE